MSFPALHRAALPRRRGISRIASTPRALVAALVILLMTLSVVPAQSSFAAVVPGSQVDLRVTVAGPSAANGGDSFSYTVTMTNNSLPDADGATFTDSFSGGVRDLAATCTSSGGGVCPGNVTVSGNDVSGTLGAFPHLGDVVITVTGYFTTGSSVTNSATIDPPSGTTDTDPSSNTSDVSTSLTSEVAMSANISTPATSITPGVPADYTLVLTNSGPAAGDGASIYSTVSTNGTGSAFGDFNVSNFRCSTTNGATCPTLADQSGLSNYSAAVNTTIPGFPSNSTVTITYTIDWTSGTGPCSPAGGWVAGSVQIQPADGVRNTTPRYPQEVRTPASPECPEAEVTVAQSTTATSIAPGSSADYTLVVTNAGPAAADGSRVSGYLTNPGAAFSTFDVGNFGCTSTNGAVCPTLTDQTGVSPYQYIVNLTLPTLPANSTVTITYTVTFAAGSTPCGASGALVTNNVSVYTTSVTNTADAMGRNAWTNTALDVPPCPEVNVTVTSSTTATSITPGGSADYTVVVSNSGPASADGTVVQNTSDFESIFGQLTVSDFGCTTTNGATCPILTGQSVGSYDRFVDVPIPTFPANSTVTITYTATFADASTGICGRVGGYVGNTVQVQTPDEVTNTALGSGATSRRLETPVAPCADVSVNSSVTPGSIQAGDQFAYLITVTNSGNGTADATQLTDPLGSNITFVSATCAASAGTPSCGAVTFDPATKTVRSVIPSLSPGDAVTFTINATGGVTAGNVANIAAITSTSTSTSYDPELSSNRSQVNLQIFNTTSTITVVKDIRGLGAGGLSSPLTFTGTIVCATQATQNWSVTVPAGATSAASSSVNVFDKEDCTVSEDAPPSVPAGYTWTAGPVISPAVIDGSQTATAKTVTVTNTAVPDPLTSAAVIVRKEITGASSGFVTDQTFTGQVTCTLNGSAGRSYSWSATVVAGATAANADAIIVPAGSECTVTEDTPPTPPAGYEWLGPLITPATSGTLSAGTTTDFLVDGRLSAVAPDTGSVRISKEITGAPAGGIDGTFTFTAFCDADTYRAAIAITGGSSGTATIDGIPAGVDCAVKETGKSAAPNGYTWADPVVSADLVTVVKNIASEITVTNPLRVVAPGASDGRAPRAQGTTASPTGSLAITGYGVDPAAWWIAGSMLLLGLALLGGRRLLTRRR